MDIDANAVIAEISEQRNKALDDLALTRAALKQAQEQLAESTKE